jgi:hypothetical protein
MIIKETDFDFGFTVVDKEFISETDKAQQIWNMVKPLLNNLCQNPEKEYIHWPNRVSKIEEFKIKVENILNSD